MITVSIIQKGVEQMNILLAEDDPKLGRLLVHMLKQQFHQVDWVEDGQSAYDYGMTNMYEIIVLDWMMPHMTGAEVCKKLREDGCTSSILMLTARDSVEDRVTGLDAGADDYIVKPFEFEELFARIRALSRRVSRPLAEDIVTIGALSLNRSTHTLLKDGYNVGLTHKEYQFMEQLMLNKGRILTREQLIDKIWGIDSDVSSNNLDALVKLVRKKINDNGDVRVIKSVRNIGYQLGDLHDS